MTYAELLEEVKEKKVAKLIEYEVCSLGRPRSRSGDGEEVNGP